MTLPLPPGPDDWRDAARRRTPRHDRRPTGAPLNQRERAALDDIADDLATTDPYLVAQLSRRDGPFAWWPVSGWATAALVAGLLLLIGIAQALPSSGWIVLAAATVLVALSWIVLVVRPRPRRCGRRGRPEPGERPT